LPLWGGIVLPLAIGAVVDGLSCDSHTPLSGHVSPVLAVVPIGFRESAIAQFLIAKNNVANFGLKKSFGIDSGELDGLSSQQCFVLGYELADIDHLLKAGDGIHKPVHADNRQRIEAACRDVSRPYHLTWLPGDSSESWLLLEVPPAEVAERDASL
jgi:hypothetical protein